MTKQAPVLPVLTLNERAKQFDIDIRAFKGNKVLRNLLYLWYIRKIQFLSPELEPTKHTKGISLKIIQKDLNCSEATAELYNKALILFEEIELWRRELDDKIVYGEK